MTERITLDADKPAEVFTDVPARRIRGLAIPADATATKAGRTWRFLPESVAFGARTPLLAYHDTTRPVGLLTSARWTAERGLEVEFTVSKTPAGDEALQLAADGVLGLSVGIDVPTGGARQVGDVLTVSRAHAAEVSLTPCPAFAGSVIDHVALSGDAPERTAMPDTPETPAATVALDADALGAAIGAAMMAHAATTGPTPVPVPTARVTAEEAPYRFDGTPGRFSFCRDAMAGYGRGDHEAKARIESFLSETFVSTANVSGLTPVGFRPDLYVDSRPPQRVLGGMVSGGVLDSINPFVVPKFASAANLVGPHTEGVEPTLATFTATDATVEPHALSGKAEITRELADKAGPQVDAMIWNKMVRASVTAAEERIADLLAAHTDASPLALTGADVALADDLDATLLGVTELERYGYLASNPALFAALATARDTAGRKLFAAINPQNADGTSRTRRTLDLNGMTVVQSNALTDSYLIEQGAIYQWLSAPRKLNFDIQVKSIFIGFWQYSAEAIVDDAGIRRVTYAA